METAKILHAARKELDHDYSVSKFLKEEDKAQETIKKNVLRKQSLEERRKLEEQFKAAGGTL